MVGIRVVCEPVERSLEATRLVLEVLDVPRERTLCGDLLPSSPIYRELTRADLRNLCPTCVDLAEQARVAGRRPVAARNNGDSGQMQQFDLNMMLSGS